jgi:hypothetical protein
MHKAIIIGAGRMGSGYGLTPESHYYVHAKTYMDLSSRVELVGFVEPDAKRTAFTQETWHLPVYSTLKEALGRQLDVNIVSVCTQPTERQEIMDTLHDHRVAGVWCEKPYAMTWTPKAKVQVNYCRRFDLLHQQVRNALERASHKRLVVMAKKDVHTVCHLTDLARYWNVDHLDYVDTPGEPGAYALRFKRDGEWVEQFFPKGGISGDEFMRVALTNLLDAVDGKAGLISPPENAIESEAWANKILKG